VCPESNFRSMVIKCSLLHPACLQLLHPTEKDEWLPYYDAQVRLWVLAVHFACPDQCVKTGIRCLITRKELLECSTSQLLGLVLLTACHAPAPVHAVQLLLSMHLLMNVHHTMHTMHMLLSIHVNAPAPVLAVLPGICPLASGRAPCSCRP
jgi:hypothetical protein